MSSNGVQDPSATEQTSADTPVEQTEVGKGKGKAAAEEPTMDSEEEDEASSGEDEEQAEGDVEEADDDNMEEIDTTNIVDARTRGKNIDFAQAAKDLEDQDDEDDEDDDDFEDDDAMEE